jgi:hypothetical protein
VYENAEAKAELQKIKENMSKFITTSRKDNPEDFEVGNPTPNPKT